MSCKHIFYSRKLKVQPLFFPWQYMLTTSKFLEDFIFMLTVFYNIPLKSAWIIQSPLNVSAFAENQLHFPKYWKKLGVFFQKDCYSQNFISNCFKMFLNNVNSLVSFPYESEWGSQIWKAQFIEWKGKTISHSNCLAMSACEIKFKNKFNHKPEIFENAWV